jgi:hypothetical protein
MAQEVLVNYQLEAGEELVRKFSEKFPVSVAFWLSPVDSELWYLHLASPNIHDTNIGEAYGELLRIMQAPRFGSLNPFQVKLLNAADPLPIAAATVQSRYHIPQPIPFHGSSLADTAINGAYIYPATTLAGSTP